MTEKRKFAVVAVGGNALVREKGKESVPEQDVAACLRVAAKSPDHQSR